jgi:hypothetical protein
MTEGPAGPSLRDRLARSLTSPVGTTLLLAVAFALLLVAGPAGYGFGLLAVGAILWATRWDWSRFGLARPAPGRLAPTARRALLWTLGAFLLVDLALAPAVEQLTERPHDLSAFAALEGDPFAWLALSAFMWITAAFGEELVFRGFLQRELARLLGDGTPSRIAATGVTAVFFGAVHLYQGVSGVVTTGVMGLLLGVLFWREGGRLLPCILVHGFYDMIGITLIFLGLVDTSTPGTR